MCLWDVLAVSSLIACSAASKLMSDPDPWRTLDNPPSAEGHPSSAWWYQNPCLCLVMSEQSGGPCCRCTQTMTSAQLTFGSAPTCCHQSPLPPSHGPSLRVPLMGHTPSGIMGTTSTLLQASRASRANQVTHGHNRAASKAMQLLHLARPGPIKLLAVTCPMEHCISSQMSAVDVELVLQAPSRWVPQDSTYAGWLQS